MVKIMIRLNIHFRDCLFDISCEKPLVRFGRVRWDCLGETHRGRYKIGRHVIRWIIAFRNRDSGRKEFSKRTMLCRSYNRHYVTWFQYFRMELLAWSLLTWKRSTSYSKLLQDKFTIGGSDTQKTNMKYKVDLKTELNERYDMIMGRATSNKLMDSVPKRLIKVISEIIEKPLSGNIWGF